MEQKNIQRRTTLIGVVTIVIGVIIVTAISGLLYKHTVNLMTTNLKERLIAIVSTAVVHIDSNDIEALQTEEDWKKPEWRRVVRQMEKVRLNNEDILYVYIFRKTEDDPTQMEFVVDSHSMNPYANLDDDPSNDVDLDDNGVIDDSDWLQWPGQEYPEPPEDAFLAYNGPITNRELYEDQWGKVITGYAPIIDDDGKAIAVLAVDIEATDFFVITQQTLQPFLIFIAALVFILLILTSVIIHIWNKRVSFMAELDRQKDELLSIVSHQLATPVSSAKWYLEMMLDGDIGDLTKEQEKHLDTVKSVMTNLADLVSMILDVSRIQLGRMKVDRTDLNLSEFFDEILNVIKAKAEERNVELEVDMPSHLPVASLDKRLMRMTLENLLSNAVKYSNEANGKVLLEVSANNGALTYSVHDNGCGIPKADQDKIFGKLFRASNVQKIDGNGFGLYAAKGAVEAQGGSIHFESTENKGTTFYVKIPLNQAS